MRRKILILPIMAIGLTGCGMTGGDVAKLQLVNQLSKSEVIDYYAKAISFDAVVSRNVDKDKVTYETLPVQEETKEIINGLVEEAQSILVQNSYDGSSKSLDISTFNYIKALLNDKKLSNANIESVTQALGYYFVDVTYDIKSGELGQLKPSSSLIGINGAFSQDYLGVDSINNAYAKLVVNNLSSYYKNNKIDKTVAFDAGNGSIVMSNSDMTAIKLDSNTRSPKVDAEEINNLAGSSKTESAYMPNIDLIYTKPKQDGSINGIGLYASGDYGLRKFGYDRSKATGTIKLRYVFKSDVLDRTNIYGVNVYPVMMEMQSGFSSDTDNVMVPDFLMKEFSKLVDRADRALINNDLTALVSGEIYSDNSIGILNGYELNYTNLLKNMSTIRRVITRDMENNSYLLEVETVRQEGSKGSDSYGTYRDKSYVSVEQVGDKFIITDSVLMLRQMTSEPAINPDKANKKRLVALNLSGEVPDESKKEIKSLIADWYNAGNNRVMKGPKNDVERGMYDCFNTDKTMLSEDRLEYINSEYRSLLVKNGPTTKSVINGIITEWIGGNENQAEFMTEEVIQYSKGTGTRYLQSYYLVSNHSGEWVIDDIKIIESEDKDGEELKQILDRVVTEE